MPARKGGDKATGRAAAGHPAVKPPVAVKIEPERANFKTLLLKNPNYFGTMPELGIPPVKVLNQKTSYEELTCIGLHPQGERLQAVVEIKRHSGYGGGTCDDGSVEYVRFFVRRGAAWHDLGVASFTAHDLPAGSPLPVSYSVEMAMDEARKWCTVENVVEVRGILSWNWEPPAGNPAWSPPWGNVLDVRVQIAPWELPLVKIATLIEDKLVTIDPSILASVDLDLTLKPKSKQQPLQYAALKEKYRGKNVPGHRSGFLEAQKLLAEPLSAKLLAQAKPAKPAKKAKKGEAVAAAPAFIGPFDASIIPDLSEILDELIATSGNTDYEELECAGYNPETRMLNGVIAIKRNSGYSGDLCDPGSTEYVGFWVFHGGSWHSLGTAQVQVHDLAAITPGNPVRYAVFRGVNLPEHLCADIAGLPLRAILSWQTPPTGPGFDPVWGNVVNTYVQPIIVDELPGDQRVRLMRINRVNVVNINGAGFAQDAALPIAGDCTNAEVNNSPFGGPIFIEGDFTVKSDAYFDPEDGTILPGQHPPAYQVWVQRLSSPAPWPSPVQLTNAFNIAVFPANPGLGDPPAVTVTQSVQPFGGADYYLYREGIIQAVNPRMLAVWQAEGLDEGLYEIEVRGFVWNGLTYVPMATPSQTERVYVFNGFPHTELDSNGDPFTAWRPQVELHITSPSGDCGDVVVGDTVEGTYEVNDHFFGTLGLGLVQITVGGIPQPINPVVPSGPTFYPAAGTNGTSGTWTLETEGMTPCGYTIVLSAWDRALVANACHGHYNQTAVGFCLREPEE